MTPQERIKFYNNSTSSINQFNGNRIQSYLDVVQVMLVAIDSKGVIQMVNKKTCQVLGYDELEITGKKMQNFIFIKGHENNKNFEFNQILDLSDGETGQFETTIKTEAGEERLISWSAAPIIDDQNNTIEILCSGQDITEKHKAVLQIKESEQKYRMLVETMDEGVMIVDNQDIIQFVNRKNCEIMGYSAEEMIGKRAKDLLLDEEYKPYVEKVLKEREEGDSSQYEIPIKTQKGDTRWILINGCPLYNHNNELIGSIGIHTDITIRKRIETELIAAKEKSEELSRIKDVFFANMSHEIRTPMNGIVGLTKLLDKTELSKKQVDYVKAIEKSADHLLVIINDILDFSKMEAGKIEFDVSDFNLHKLIINTVKIFSYRAAEKSLTLHYDIDSEVPVFCKGDKVRLNQILTNLVGNAIKFTAHGGVSLGVSLNKSTGKDITLRIEVKDTGIGVPEDMKEEIFQSFIQSSSGIHGKYGGTGLGLPIVKKLVEMHNGSIVVESVEGGGSNFVFTIDLKLGEEVQENPVQSNDIAPLNLHVLIAEDNEINQMVITETMKSWSCTYDVVSNGHEAIKKMEINCYDIVLMDIQMPEMNGIEATNFIRNMSDHNKAFVPIIALTAHATKKEKELGEKVGFSDYITKPFNRLDLYQKFIEHTVIG